MTQSTRIATESTAVALPTGRLELSVVDADWPLERLLGFAARRNPRRGFLFVSRVLGRYSPVAPSSFRAALRALTAKIPTFEGPVVVIGVAEAGVGLARGIHELLGRDDALFLSSTRYRLDEPTLACFSEPHSHAPEHHLYRPTGARERALLAEARTLIVVDDEATTGRTFTNLVSALEPCLPRMTRALQVVLTDWSAGLMPPSPDRISLLRGAYRFTPSGQAVAMPDVRGRLESKSALLTTTTGRLGLSSPPDLRLPAALDDVRPDERILLLGTGELHYPAFRFAERLEARGIHARFCTTTRAPVLIGHEIRSVIDVGDCYRDPIPGYLYNCDPGDWDRIVLCHETPADCIPPRLRVLPGLVPVRIG